MKQPRILLWTVHFQLQLGMELFPERVSWTWWVPSASMVHISVWLPMVR
jgi:hypothetical protein